MTNHFISALCAISLSSAASTACSSSEDEPLPEQVEPGWHVGVYMAADNNLDSAASVDLKEMIAAKTNGAARVTVFVDRAEPEVYSPSSVEGIARSGEAAIYRLEQDGFTLQESLGEVNSTDPSTLLSFVERLLDEPEQRKALILWNHGSPGAYGTDETDDSGSLGLEELGEVFRQAGLGDAIGDGGDGDPNFDGGSSRARRLDILGFDTCLLSSAAALETFAPFSRVYVASAELEPGSGWDYEGLLTEFTDPEASPEEFGRIAVETFGRFYRNNPRSANRLDVTLAAWSTELSAVNEAAQGLVLAGADPDLLSEPSALYTSLTRAFTAAHGYNENPSRPPTTVDLGDILSTLQSEAQDPGVQNAAEAYVQALREARLAWSSAENIADRLGLSAQVRGTAGTIGDFLANTLGEDAAGRLELIDEDRVPPSIVMELDSVGDNPGVSFAIVKVSASDDALLSQVRVSLARDLGDGQFEVYSSFRIDDATGRLELPEALYGVPLAGWSLENGSAAPADLTTLLLHEAQLLLTVSVRSGDVVHDGLIYLGDEGEPAALGMESTAYEASVVLDWEQVLSAGNFEIAPTLGLLEEARESLAPRLGSYRPAADVSIFPVNVEEFDGLDLIATATDVAGDQSTAVLPLP